MKDQAHRIKTVEMGLRSLAVTGHAIAAAIHKLCEGLEFCAEKLRISDEMSRRARKKRRTGPARKSAELRGPDR